MNSFINDSQGSVMEISKLFAWNKNPQFPLAFSLYNAHNVAKKFLSQPAVITTYNKPRWNPKNACERRALIVS